MSKNYKYRTKCNICGKVVSGTDYFKYELDKILHEETHPKELERNRKAYLWWCEKAKKLEEEKHKRSFDFWKHLKSTTNVRTELQEMLESEKGARHRSTIERENQELKFEIKDLKEKLSKFALEQSNETEAGK